MIRTLRAFFLRCLLREKLLVVVFLAIAVLLWLSGFSKRAGSFWRDQRRTTVDLTEQAQWISHSAAIEAAAQKAAGRLVASSTLDGTRLLEAVQKIAADLGLRNTQSNGLTNPPGNGQFAVHTLDYTVRFNDPDPSGDKNMQSLNAFYAALQKRSPYIGIDSFTVAPTPSNRSQLSLVLKVSSVEVLQQR
jgi:hypothetical protein